MPLPISLIFAHDGIMKNTDRSDVLAVIHELCGVMKNQDQPLAGRKPITGRLEMASENLRFADAVVGKEPVGSLRVRPVLTDPWNATTHTVG